MQNKKFTYQTKGSTSMEELTKLEMLELSLKYSQSEKHKKSLEKRIKELKGEAAEAQQIKLW